MIIFILKGKKWGNFLVFRYFSNICVDYLFLLFLMRLYLVYVIVYFKFFCLYLIVQLIKNFVYQGDLNFRFQRFKCLVVISVSCVKLNKGNVIDWRIIVRQNDWELMNICLINGFCFIDEKRREFRLIFK